jgi:hypothetical protein
MNSELEKTRKRLTVTINDSSLIRPHAGDERRSEKAGGFEL